MQFSDILEKFQIVKVAGTASNGNPIIVTLDESDPYYQKFATLLESLYLNGGPQARELLEALVSFRDKKHIVFFEENKAAADVDNELDPTQSILKLDFCKISGHLAPQSH